MNLLSAYMRKFLISLLLFSRFLGLLLILNILGMCFASYALAETFDPHDPYTDIDPSKTLPQDRSYLNKSSDFILFVTSYLKHVYPDTIPLPEEVTNTAGSFATLGEYEPLSFSVLARRNLANLSVRVEDLKLRGNASVSLGQNNLDLRMVRVQKMRYERLITQVENVPEILDHAKPIALGRDEVKQYWLTIKVPEKATPGRYKGRVIFSANGAADQELTINFRVYPVTLLKNPEKYHGVYQNTARGTRFLYNGQVIDLTDRYWEIAEACYKDIKEHGGETIVGAEAPKISGRGAAIQFDYTDFTRSLDLAKAVGLDKPRALSIDALLYSKILDKVNGDRNLADRFLKQTVQERLNLARQRNYPPIYFYPVDEVESGNEKEPDFLRLAPLIKQAGGKVYVTSYLNYFQEQDNLIDLRNYNSRSERAGLDYRLTTNAAWENLGRDIAASGDLAWTYYNMRGGGGRPEFYRVVNGIWLWLKPLKASTPWTYQDVRDRELFDLFLVSDPTPGNVPYALSYPDPDNNFLPTLPSLKWEGYREGVDDLKYIYTLEQEIAFATSQGKPQDVINKAQQVLRDLRSRVLAAGPSAESLARDFYFEDYQYFRQLALANILALRAGTSPPDVLVGDLNADGVVNETDRDLFRPLYLTTSTAADFDRSGLVDGSDYLILVNNFGRRRQ